MAAFKRNFYYETIENIKRYQCTFILGARQCGKTFCLHQINEAMSENNDLKSCYYDFKKMTDDERYDIMDEILESIKNNENKLFLLDELTYLPLYDKQVGCIKEAFTNLAVSGTDARTRIVFTGSQSFALDFVASIYFGGTAGIVRPEFLQYSEWLEYKDVHDEEILSPCKESYFQFLLEVNEFYHLDSIHKYVKGCIDETIISNTKSGDAVRGNSINIEKNKFTEICLDIMYATMIPLHDQSTIDNFNSREKLNNLINTYFRRQYKEIGKEEIGAKIDSYLSERYHHLSGLSYHDFLSGLVFLYKNNLISLTYNTNHLEKTGSVIWDIEGERLDIDNKADFLSNVLIDVNYPMFLFAMIKDIVHELDITDIARDLYGSALECHLRGLLPDRSCAEYNNEKNHQVDYIDTDSMTAIEFTISDIKRLKDLHFNELPDGYSNILLCGKGGFKDNNILYIPFFEFIIELEKNNTLTYIRQYFEQKYSRRGE